MDDIKAKFITFCGDKYEKFMDKLYANENGEIELKFWQEKLINKFLESNDINDVSVSQLAEVVRDGAEVMYGCPIPDCEGDVACINRTTDTWACNHCGQVWQSKAGLQAFRDIAAGK